MKKKRLGCGIALVLTTVVIAYFAYGIYLVLTPRDMSQQNPEEVFREFVCSPIPSSVKIISVDGSIAFAGGNVYIEFTMDASDRDDLLSGGSFVKLDESSGGRLPVVPFENIGSVETYRQNDESLSDSYLYLSKNSNKCFFHQAQY
ncbi:MAG: hypothetical protein H7A51_13745 [Akkermansiaceae bacterium]|nr:hypothetical protein [Akkermansiaceae bacterium]